MYWFPHTDRLLTKRNNRSLEPAEPLSRFRGWLDDEFLSNRVFGWSNRLTNLRPGLVPRLNDLSGRALSERRFSDVPHKVFTSPRRVVFREMEYAVPREAGVQALREARDLIDASDWRISFPVEIRVCPGRRRAAVHGVRPRLGLPGLPHQPADRPHRLLPRRRADHALATTAVPTGASCTPARPRTSRRRTRGGRSSRRCATSSTPTGSSPTPTSTGCWADGAGPTSGSG